LAPSYNGRSKVVLIRQILGRFPLSLLLPWALPFCLLPVFNNLAQGAFFLSLILLFFSLLGVWFVCGKTRERYQVPEDFMREPILKSLKTTVSNPEFWRLSGAIVIILSGMALFAQIGGYLFVYYLSAEGDLMLGATRIAIVATQGALVGIVAMFVVIRMCMKRQKHEAFLFSLAMMIIGLVLQWWCLSPDRLWAIFVVPFFCSFGMSGALISLSAMYPDVTDVDELRSGMRREGMFVFAAGGVVKFFTAGTPFFAGLILWGTGFDVSAGVHQPEGVFVRMRILFSFVPALFVALAFLMMRNYPLTRKRMEEIQDQIKERELGV
jgi:GPH family glycoside/pentoside/hexuronide:cation symporter